MLAIAASTAACSLALHTTIGVLHWHSSLVNQHSEQLLPAVQHLLNQAQLLKPDLIAVDIGPGAFTSVRVACGIAQGLALGWGCPVVAVESLTALAHQALLDHPQVRTVVCLLDARMGECYEAHYALSTNGIIQTCAPQLSPYMQTLHCELNHTPDAVIGNAANVLPHWNTLAALAIHAHPSAAGVLAAARAVHPEQWLLPEQLHPLYVRNQVALTAQERAQTSVQIGAQERAHRAPQHPVQQVQDRKAGLLL